MDKSVLVTFCFVYLGMILGKVPGLAMDRTGIALLGAIILVDLGKVSPESAWMAIDVPTITLLLGLMVISAQFRLGGFYAHVTRRLGSMELSPKTFLGLLIAVVALLSAVLANDIVCLAVTPVLIEVCSRRHLDPLPFLLALACASNIGSAATLIGNPQNMLIGQALHLSFPQYLLDSSVPVLLGLGSIWYVLDRQVGSNWHKETPLQTVDAPRFSLWQTSKGGMVLGALLICFLFTDWPRDAIALGAAGLLLSSRKMASRKILGMVDWQLLVLFAGLFIVNHTLQSAGLVTRMMEAVRTMGINLDHPAWLFICTVVLSNLVSNVPATMLLLPTAVHPVAGPILALASTFAGNLFLVGSIANLIMVEQARELDVHISWKDHARLGIPITLMSLTFAALWLWIESLFLPF